MSSFALQEAERCGIHRTVHAGEAGPPAMIKEVRGAPGLGQGAGGTGEERGTVLEGASASPTLGREEPKSSPYTRASVGDPGRDLAPMAQRRTSPGLGRWRGLHPWWGRVFGQAGAELVLGGCTWFSRAL